MRRQSQELEQISGDIARYYDDLRRTLPIRKIRVDKDRRNFYATSMILFALSNRVIDLARLVVYTCGYAKADEPLKSKVLFKRLYDRNVITYEMRQELIAIVSFRNKISHHFYDIREEDLEMLIVSLPKLSEFICVMNLELERFRSHRSLAIAATIAISLCILIYLLIYG